MSDDAGPSNRGGGLLRPEPPAAARVASLDMTSGHDRRDVQLAAEGRSKRYGKITPEMRDQFVDALKVAMRWSIEKKDQRAVDSCVRTMGYLDKIQQADEHLAYKQANPEQHLHKHEHMVQTLDGFALRIAQIALDLMPDDKLALFQERLGDEIRRLKQP